MIIATVGTIRMLQSQMFQSQLYAYLGLNPEDIIPKAFWDEITIFDKYEVSVSGGVDSSAVAVAFHNRGIPFSLVWNNTRRSMPTARIVLAQLFRLGHPFTIIYPHHSQKMISRKTKAKVKYYYENPTVKYRKNDLPCCYYLKKAPFRKHKIDAGTLVISSIAGYEGEQRQTRLGTLRKKNTFLRYKTSDKRFWAYPLRDYTRKRDRLILQNYLFNNKFYRVRNSGCYSCPVIVMFEEQILKNDPSEKERINRSKKVYGEKVIL